MHVGGHENVWTVDTTLDEIVQHGRKQRQTAHLGRTVTKFIQYHDGIRRGRVESGVYLKEV